MASGTVLHVLHFFAVRCSVDYLMLVDLCADFSCMLALYVGCTNSGCRSVLRSTLTLS